MVLWGVDLWYEGGGPMKRIVFCLLMLSALVGCSNTQSEENYVYTEPCSICSDSVDRWIETAYGDNICARCFMENDWDVCASCGLAYDLNEFDCADGYCTGCAELKTWQCSVCEGQYALDHLADLGNGYYLCTGCAGSYLLEAAPEISSEIEAISPFVSRDDYFLS